MSAAGAIRVVPGDMCFLIFIYIYIYIYLFIYLYHKIFLHPFFCTKYHKIISFHASDRKRNYFFQMFVLSFSTFNDLGLRLLAMGGIQALRAKLFLIPYILISCLTMAMKPVALIRGVVQSKFKTVSPKPKPTQQNPPSDAVTATLPDSQSAAAAVSSLNEKGLHIHALRCQVKMLGDWLKNWKSAPPLRCRDSPAAHRVTDLAQALSKSSTFQK